MSEYMSKEDLDKKGKIIARIILIIGSVLSLTSFVFGFKAFLICIITTIIASIAIPYLSRLIVNKVIDKK